MEALSLHTGEPTVHWEDNASFICGVEDKVITPKVKHIDVSVFFYTKNLIVVILLSNTRSLVSFWQICSPNHFQVQLSVRVLNK